jgi:hypothetical protein
MHKEDKELMLEEIFDAYKFEMLKLANESNRIIEKHMMLLEEAKLAKIRQNAPWSNDDLKR